MIMAKPPTKSTRCDLQQGELPELPQAAVINILQNVPLRQRLSCCSLVCRAWAAAATLISTDLEAYLQDAAKCQQMQDWLRPCAGQVVSMKLRAEHGFACSIIQLPCNKLTKLQSLSLEDLKVVLNTQQGSMRTRSRSSRSRALDTDSSSSATTSIHPQTDTTGTEGGFLPQLKRLQLLKCELALKGLQDLCQVSDLSSLILFRPTIRKACNFSSEAGPKEVRTGVHTLLQKLPVLSELSLSVKHLDAAALSPISALQHLQVLQLMLPSDASASSTLAHLPTTLTALGLDTYYPTNPGGLPVYPHLSHINEEVVFEPSNLPQLAQLSGLQDLQLKGMLLDPAVLYSFPNLLRLCLHELMPVVMQADDSTQPDTYSRDLEALLGAIGQLPKLLHLEVCSVGLCNLTELQHCTALTASSHLTLLKFADRGDDALPAGALQHMLPPGKQLPHLKVLQLGDNTNNRLATESMHSVTAADLSCVAHSCPALQALDLIYVMEAPSDAAALAQLPPTLTRLHVGGAAFGDVAAAGVARVTSLRALRWDFSPLSLTGLQHLTALTGLTELWLISWKYMRNTIEPSPNAFWYTPKVCMQKLPEKAGPEVWQEIERYCNLSGLAAGSTSGEPSEKN